jgi:hypothetical protein
VIVDDAEQIWAMLPMVWIVLLLFLGKIQPKAQELKQELAELKRPLNALEQAHERSKQYVPFDQDYFDIGVLEPELKMVKRRVTKLVMDELPEAVYVAQEEQPIKLQTHKTIGYVEEPVNS